MLPILLALALAALPLPAGAGLIQPAPAYYPRLISLQGGGAGAVLEAPTPQQRRLLYLPRSAHAWGPPALIAAAAMDSAGSVDLANGSLLQLANGTLLCAYRHHDGVGTARVYRLQVSASADLGRTWALAATITQGPTGVWEPCLFLTASGALRVASAAAVTTGGEQDFVLRAGLGGGEGWGPILSRLHTPGARNGMPGVAVLPGDGSLLVVHEAFVGPACSVRSARSGDGGGTWGQRQEVRAPALPARAGSPQVALCRNGTAACAVFMSSEGGGSSGAWPEGARTVALCAPLDSGNASAAVDWGAGGAPSAVATATRFSLWPSLLTRGGSGGVLGVAYQGSDGAAYLDDAFAC